MKAQNDETLPALEPYPASVNANDIAIKKTHFTGHTKFQHVAVVDTREFGKMLMIEGCCQTAQSDEYIYHESLIHPALISHAKPENILIIGGAEGAALREILRHPCVKKVVLVDIDSELVNVCEKYLPEWHCGAFKDPRVELEMSDAKKFVLNSKTKFDAIFVDICEDLENVTIDSMYSQEFLKQIKERLNPDGVMVLQTMEMSTQQDSEHMNAYRNLNNIFQFVDSYRIFLPSFGCQWSFIVANDTQSVALVPPEVIEARLLDRNIDDALRFYDGTAHIHLFSLSKDLKKSYRSAFAS